MKPSPVKLKSIDLPDPHNLLGPFSGMDGQPKKKEKPKKSLEKPKKKTQKKKRCPNGTRRDKASGECVSKFEKSEPSKSKPKPQPKKKPKTKRTLKPCKPGQERNPATNRCRKIRTPKKIQPKKITPKKVQPKKSTPQTVSMSDDDKQVVAERIAKRAFDLGRNPLDTAGMDTDDEEWMGENPDYEDYVEQVYQELVDSKPKKASPKKENKYKKGELVKVLGSDNLTWKIIDIKSSEEYDFIYSLELVEGDAVLEDLPWIPECLLVKKASPKKESPKPIKIVWDGGGDIKIDGKQYYIDEHGDLYLDEELEGKVVGNYDEDTPQPGMRVGAETGTVTWAKSYNPKKESPKKASPKKVGKYYAKFYDIAEEVDPEYHDNGHLREKQMDNIQKVIERHPEFKPGDILFVGSTYETRQEYGFAMYLPGYYKQDDYMTSESGFDLPITAAITTKTWKTIHAMDQDRFASKMGVSLSQNYHL